MKKEKSWFKELKKEDVPEFLLDNVFWFIGCFFYALAINIFNVPNQIAQGGFSGLAIVVNHLTGLPVGAVNFALNIPLFILAWFFVGRRFVFRSLWVTAMLSVIIDVMAKYSKPFEYTKNPLLAAIFGGACCGVGVALVLYRGATTGGTDILGRLLRLIAPHISYGRVIMAADITVVAIAAIVFRNVESAMYAAIVIFVSSKAIDFILYGFNKTLTRGRKRKCSSACCTATRSPACSKPSGALTRKPLPSLPKPTRSSARGSGQAIMNKRISALQLHCSFFISAATSFFIIHSSLKRFPSAK